MGDDSDIKIKEKLKPYEKWRDEYKEKWKYKQKLVVFEDENGNIVTPSTTTTTTTTTTVKPVTTPAKNVTKYPTIVIADLTTQSGGRTDAVATADTTQLIKTVGITCASLIGFIIIVLVIIRICRRASAKRRQRLTVRRPLTETEREEHIYAEIEPLQRAPSPGGASGTSADVQLPRRKGKKRRTGVSSFRSLSTRIYRFFNVDTDDQSVFYNQSSQSVRSYPPEPPLRNVQNGRTTNRQVHRGPSTASRRPLLDGDSRGSTSSATESRSNIYNPLNKADVRASGPYDHLTLNRTPSGHIEENTSDPSSPHDYFKLENTETGESTDSPDKVNGGTVDSIVVENETGSGIDTITEEDEPCETPKHDYFILEPHEREDGVSATAIKDKSEKVTSKQSDKAVSPTEGVKPKPQAAPRSDKQSQSSPSSSEKKPDSKVEEVKRSESKEETYVLAKFGDAPKPPDAVNDDEYLSPAQVDKKPDYVDVLPYPPPRSTSLQPHELSANSSPVLDKKSPFGKDVSRSRSGSPLHKNGPTTPDSSPTRLSHPKNSPTKSSPTKSSPSKSSSTKSSPTKSHQPSSPTKSKTETTI